MYETYSIPYSQFIYHKSWRWSETKSPLYWKTKQLRHPSPYFHYLQMSFKNVDYNPCMTWLPKPLSAGTAYIITIHSEGFSTFQTPFLSFPCVLSQTNTAVFFLSVAFPRSSSHPHNRAKWLFAFLLSVLWREAASLCPPLRDTYLDSSWQRLPAPNPESHPIHDPLLLLTSNLHLDLVVSLIGDCLPYPQPAEYSFC